MKPILILAIAAVAAGAMGTGFLNNTNGIDLWIQQFGVGEGDITSPVSHAFVDFNIARVDGQPTGTFDNVIESCDLRFDENLNKDAKIFCKLTDWAGDIIAEGSTMLTSPLSTDVAVNVPVTNGDNNVLLVKDVIIVVQDNGYSPGLATTIVP